MKLSITITDKPKDKDFNYNLHISKTQTALVCGTLLAGMALVAWCKRR